MINFNLSKSNKKNPGSERKDPGVCDYPAEKDQPLTAPLVIPAIR